jgi:dihydrofolate reductase
MSLEIIIIVAVSENNVIGKDNKLPWKIKEDLQRFKAMTTGWPCIMGRKTYESLTKPLPNRQNIVISSNKNLDERVIVCSSLSDAIQYCSNYEKVFICGGSAVYSEAIDVAHRIELTRIHKVVEGDTFFPHLGLKWRIETIDNHDEFSFITYKKL